MFGRFRRRREQELDEEIESHLRLAVADRIARGESPAQAEAAARRELGHLGLIKEATREAWGWMWLDRLGRDLRHGLRALRRSPSFTAMVVLTLGLGIGANAAIFSLLNAVLLRPLPVRDPGGLVLLSDAAQGAGKSIGHPSRQGTRMRVYPYPLYERLRARTDVFAGLAAEDGAGSGGVLRWREGGAGETRHAAYGRAVSANFFQVLGVSMFRGRAFTREDELAGEAGRVLVLSHSFWQREFGADPAIVGSRIEVTARPYTVIGIAAPGFTGTKVADATDFWFPLALKGVQESSKESGPRPSFLGDRQRSWLLLAARLNPGVSLPTAEGTANGVFQQYLEDEPATRPEREAGQRMRVGLEPGSDGYTRWRRGYRESLFVLMAGVGLLLVIVCLNLSHLLLARGIDRQREIGIRMALGATRARLFRQALVEATLLCVLGAALAILLRGWLSDGLLALAATGPAQQALLVGADGKVVAFTALVAFATALVVGLVPAWLLSRTDVQQGLRATSRAVAGRSRQRASRVLLISQVSLSLVLLVGAGLLAGTLGRMRDADRGFDKRNVLVAGLGLETGDIGITEARALEEQVLRGVRALPSVRQASLSRHPSVLGSTEDVTVLGSGGPSVKGAMETVTAGYFEALAIPVSRGRSFSERDHLGAARVAVVNETLARRLWSDPADGGDPGQAIGKRFRFEVEPGTPAVPPDSFEVIGVVGDTRSTDLRLPVKPIAYLIAGQSMPTLLRSLTIQTAPDTDVFPIVNQLQDVLRASHPNLYVANARTMVVEIERTLGRARLLATLAVAFGLAALFLVGLGLYGVITQWGLQRTREIGVRMALGAQTAAVRWLVLRQALVLVLAGIALGIPATLAVSRSLKALLFGIAPADVATIAAAVLAVSAVAALAAYLPARRASRVDPMIALRAE